MVSYDGKAYVLLQHTRSTPTAPVRSEIRLANDPAATPLEVLYAALRPMATHRPQHMLSSDMDPAPEVGMFIFYNSPHDDTLVQAGVVVQVDAARCLVHQYRQAPKRDRQFTPLYLDTDKKSHVARVKPTASMEAAMVKVSFPDIRVTGCISDSNHIDNQLLDRLTSLGITAQR